jgi:transcriptional regulator with XRE-family HTH domain
MNLSSRNSLIDRLKRGSHARQRFVESHLSKTIAHQIRLMRESAGWTQQQLADAIGTNQNGVYRLESPNYGRPTLTTLKRVAAALDVALVVRFVPFSELVDWVSGTPRVERGLRTKALDVPDFTRELETGQFDESTAPDQAWIEPLHIAQLERASHWKRLIFQAEPHRRAESPNPLPDLEVKPRMARAWLPSAIQQVEQAENAYGG